MYRFSGQSDVWIKSYVKSDRNPKGRRALITGERYGNSMAVRDPEENFAALLTHSSNLPVYPGTHSHYGSGISPGPSLLIIFHPPMLPLGVHHYPKPASFSVAGVRDFCRSYLTVESGHNLPPVHASAAHSVRWPTTLFIPLWDMPAERNSLQHWDVT
ncbi:hypothetical protein B0H19DRAFT_1082933 [Mycena capillaripes]|nr:hypothetical protein B0H19DRAFT_1082933 [Mycena capillaripes]